MKHRLVFLTVLMLLVASPVLAQGGGSQTVAVDGFRFSVDAAQAAYLDVQHIAGDPLDYEAPGGPIPPHTQIMFGSEPLSEFPTEAPVVIRVYALAEMQGYSFYAERAMALADLLAARPDLALYMQTSSDNMNDNTLPFLPVYPAAQVIRARTQYVDSGALSGVSFVTAYAQGPAPFVSTDFFYTFQGLSADGSVYVAANLRITTDLFAAEIAEDVNWDTFIATLTTYLNESIATLNAGDANVNFTPPLNTLDQLVATFALVGD